MAEDIGKLGASLGLDVTNFKEGITTINREMRVLKSEFQASQAVMGPLATGMDGLRAKSDSLTKQIELQQQKVAKLNAIHKKAVEEKGADSRAAQNLEIQLNRATAELGKMENELKKTSTEMDKLTNNALKSAENLEKLGEKMQAVGQKMTSAGKTMSMYITAPIVAAGGAAIKLASDMEESVNKVDVAFKRNAQKVKDWSKNTLRDFGIAKGTALDMAALFGDMSTSMGLTTGEASKMSTSLVGLAGDLASFKNIRIEVAETALKSIYTGETESLKNLGIVMTQANLQAFAMSQGIEKNIQDMTEAEKINLRYAYVMDKTKNAQGDFARTFGAAANQSRTFQESMKEIGTSFGQILLPEFTKVITKVNEGVKRFGELDDGTKKLILTIAGIAAVAGPTLIATGKLITAVGAITKAYGAYRTAVLAKTAAETASTVATKGLNVALLGLSINPIVLGLTAVAVAIGAIAWAANNASKEAKAMAEKMINAAKEEAAAAEELATEKHNARVGALEKELMAEEEAYGTRVQKLDDEYAARIENAKKSEQVTKDSINAKKQALDEEYKDNIKRIQDEFGVVEETTKSKIELVKEHYAQEMRLIDDRKAALDQDYQNSIQRIRDEYGVFEEKTKSRTEVIREQFDEEIKLATDTHNAKIKLLDEEYAAKLRNLDDELYGVITGIQDEIKAIDEKTKEENRLEKERRDNEKVLRLQSQIDNEEDAGKRKALQEELQKFLAEKAREKILEQRELEKDALKQRIEEAKVNAQEKKDILADELANQKTELANALEQEKIDLGLKRDAAIAMMQEERKAKEIEEKLKYQAALETLEKEKTELEAKKTVEITAIQAERKEKELAETAKYKAAKTALDQEITELENKKNTEIAAIQAERKEKELAETKKYNAASESLNKQLTAMDGYAEKYTGKLEAELAEKKRIEKAKVAEVRQSVTDQITELDRLRKVEAADASARLEAQVAEINKNKGKADVGDLWGGYHPDLWGAQQVLGRAIGDNNWRGGLVQVHEKGGEILNLPKGAQIIPNDISTEMARSFGAEMARNNQVSITGNTFVIREEADIMKVARKLYDLQQQSARSVGVVPA